MPSRDFLPAKFVTGRGHPMIRSITVLLASTALALAACATGGGSQEEATRSTIGKSGDLVLRHWGPPAREATLSDGSRVWEFDAISEDHMFSGYTRSPSCGDVRATTQGVFTPNAGGMDYQGQTTYSQNCINYIDGIQTQTVTHQCTIRLVVGPDNIIRSAENFGDGC